MKGLVVLAALLALPLPALAQTTAPASAQLVDQGRALFNDPKLSASGQLSCATKARSPARRRWMRWRPM